MLILCLCWGLQQVAIKVAAVLVSGLTCGVAVNGLVLDVAPLSCVVADGVFLIDAIVWR